MHNSRSKKVITIHGINTDGRWQEDIKEILEPHFECVSIKYDQYRRLGETKILFDPFVVVVGVVISIYLQHGVLSFLLYLCATTAIAVLVSVLRREKTLRQVKTDFDRANFTGRAPHIIAHSLGTYFIGRIIGIFPDVRIDHLVLTGCVLKRDTPWQRFLTRNPKAVRKVRNEMASKDFVAKLALAFCGFFPGLGHAGVRGFKELSHNVEANSGCGIECMALVHNVRLDELGHSGVFVGRGHAQRFWLPFLWNLDPKDYEDFVELCLLADELESVGDFEAMGTVEDELRNRHWRWTNNFTLVDYLKDQIEYLLRRRNVKPLRSIVRQIRDTAIREMWRIVARAYEAQEAGLEAADPSMTRLLHPKLAAIFAVNAADR